jgi:hypothetical protein
LQRAPRIDFGRQYVQPFRSLAKLIRSKKDGGRSSKTAKSSRQFFISYARKDHPFVSKLKRFLKRREYGWWDYQASPRAYERPFDEELQQQIDEAEATLSVISPDWNRSEVAKDELAYSRKVGTPVFLLALKEPGPTLQLGRKTRIDFTGNHRHGFAELARALKRHGL